MRSLVVAVLALVVFGLPAYGIVDAVRISDDDWRRAEQSRTVWIVVQLVLLTIGSVLYFGSIRRTVRRAGAAGRTPTPQR